MTTYAGRPLPVWQVLDRETGELVYTARPGSMFDRTLLEGSAIWLLPSEVAHNILSGEVIYRPGNIRPLLAQMTREATATGATGQGFEATR